jgi:hypothetical protein
MPGGGDGEGGKGTSAGGTGAATTKPAVGMSNLRAVITSETSRRVSFTPLVDGPVEISLFEVGADSDYQVAIKSGNKGVIKNGKLQIKVAKNQRESIDLVLTDGFTGAIKVVGHEI